LKTLLIISLITILTACGGRQKKEVFIPPPPVVETRFVERDCGELPDRIDVDLRNLPDDGGWEAVVGPDGKGWLAVPGDVYKDMGHNRAETIRGVRELKAEIAYYEDCLTQKGPDGGESP
jgi:hypothetical protein